MLLTSRAVANPELDPANPTSFFTNVAMAMFQQMDLHDFNGNLVTVTNIPIYEDPALSGGTNINYYTPAVHRILQLAVNIFDATTNRFIGPGPTNYPTVFRPIFASQNGVATIIGYREVTNTLDAFLPMLNAYDFILVPQPENSSINMYGVPWVIGAKKGFPNFNEFSMENALQVTRRLEFTNSVPGKTTPPWLTNQIYSFTITNTFGVEAWNSYTNNYGRALGLMVSNEMNITLTNETGFSLLTVSNLPFGTNIYLTGWTGWTEQLSDNSFFIPLQVQTQFTNGIYGRTFVIPLNPPIWSATYVPRLWMTLQNRIRYVLIDTSANRVIDFVNIIKTEPAVDVGLFLQNQAHGLFPDYASSDGMWDMTLKNGLAIGILNQIQVSKNPSAPVWTDPQKFINAQKFNDNLLGNSGTNYFRAPYGPPRTIYQRISMEANDPLVHYTGPDMTSTNGSAGVRYNTVSLFAENPSLSSMGSLNLAYQPWGGRHLPNRSDFNPNQFRYDWRVKDPMVQQSDDWNFPSRESLSFEWLGRVHRGTPWQSVFLKPSNQTVGQWLNWNNDNVLITNGNNGVIDAAFSHPTNDWRIANLWARWLNTNDLTGLLSINNPDTDAWAARLDGFTALTNSTSGELDSITINSNSPQAESIAQAIQTARANTNSMSGIVFPMQVFREPGDVLATPQLSIGSPFLNTNGFPNVNLNGNAAANGITDATLEKIPTQLLPLLRADSFGKIVPANGQLEMSFSGYDGHAYAIEVSSNLTDWVIISTNYPSDGNFGTTNAPTSGQQFYRSVLLH
jgi:hypothetical protein